jgi:hypothetical protein
MTPAAVLTAASAAGRHLAASPREVSLDVPFKDPALTAPCAVYLAFGRDGALHYIGKVRRVGGDAGSRLREHIRASRRKHAAWRTLWIVPLWDISEIELRSLERALIRAYRPPGNVQHARAA